jgi:hypothetical protein
MGYAELLKDPRWQKKRLEIMERDKWTCQTCLGKESTLTVHHKSYKKDDDGKFLDPWDYSGGDLITLCEFCHESEEECLREQKKDLYFRIVEHAEDAMTIDALVSFFDTVKCELGRRVTDQDMIDISREFRHGVSL